MKRIVLMFLFLGVFIGCQSTGDNIRGPYNSSYVSDPDLYNKIYIDIYKTLSHYMGWKLSMVTTNEVALILEVDESAVAMNAADLTHLGVMNGWMLIEDSNIMLKSSQLDSLTSMNVDADLTGLPTAKFHVSLGNGTANVYVYYWLVEKFAFTHQIEYTKTLGRWNRKNEMVISGTKL